VLGARRDVGAHWMPAFAGMTMLIQSRNPGRRFTFL
jgi:hypothetical protein